MDGITPEEELKAVYAALGFPDDLSRRDVLDEIRQQREANEWQKRVDAAMIKAALRCQDRCTACNVPDTCGIRRGIPSVSSKIQNTLSPLSYGAVLEAIEELPTALRTIRRVRRLSQDQAAEEIGVGHSTLAKIEDGGQYNSYTLLRVLRWLDSQPETALDKFATGSTSSHKRQQSQVTSNLSV